jgi:hypothetical protein
MNYTNYESFLIILSRCLCVKTFKKYYYIRGSFNEHRKLNKNSINDLETVISDANLFTSEHYRQIIQLLFIFVPLVIIYFIFLDNSKTYESVLCIIGIFIPQGYALMVHEYNRILARHRIDYLKKNNIDETGENKELEFIINKFNNYKEELDKINKKFKKMSIEYSEWSNTFSIKINKISLDLHFITIEDASTFIEYLENTYQEKLYEQIIYNINIDGIKKLYLDFYTCKLNSDI